MDPFSELDDFLNDPNDSVSLSAIPTANDVPSLPLDDSPTVELSKTKTKTKALKKSNASSQKTDDKEKNTQEKFVPGRGQKRIFNKLKRIQDSLAATKKVEEALNGERSARSSRQKRTRQPVRREISTSESESDSGASAPRQMPNYVNLDSDDEYAEAPIAINRNLGGDSTALEVSENDEMKVAVKFGPTVEDYMLRPFQKFSELIAKVSARKSVKQERIFLMFNKKIVSPSSTLHSIDYIKGLVIHAHVSDQNANKDVSKEKKTKKTDEIELRIQTSMRKQPFVVHIGKSENISSLIFQCAEEFKCDAKKIRLEFDGDFLDSNKTAEEQDLEGGELIDMFVSN